MALTVVSVAYPFATAGPDAVGGAEQVLAAVDSALVRAGHRSIVIAQDGSRTDGTLVPIPPHKGIVDSAAYSSIHQHVRNAIAHTLDRWPVDVFHFHGVDFDAYLPPDGTAALATLHLPVDWYRQTALRPARPRTVLACVSETQRRALGARADNVLVVPNGVAIDERRASDRREPFALALGRVCPEKGYEHALDAARLAGCPLLLAGRIFPYDLHQRYFNEKIAPRLDENRRFIGPVVGDAKRRLLRRGRCLLVPSVVAETSSLVAMEALAAGTPVVAFPRGALAELIEDGVTGFLVRSVPEMADAILRTDCLDRDACIATARARFSETRMIDRYVSVFRALASGGSADAS
ncbi:MAG: glycosyltransferase family 4 protein [Acidobacteria bacterium]|nr:MAG: glycosyltransferase family 4 protein [Acidobacteriota bacterium]